MEAAGIEPQVRSTVAVLLTAMKRMLERCVRECVPADRFGSRAHKFACVVFWI
jgi:hypothetical protein